MEYTGLLVITSRSMVGLTRAH